MLEDLGPVTSRAAARQCGEEVYRRLGLTIPVDVRAVARQLGAKVLAEPATKEVSGALVLQKGVPVIITNRSHSLTRQRFTLAHELAHLLLHVSRNMTVAHTTREVLFRDTRASQGVDRREIQANAFAAGLLMPQDEVRMRVRTALGPFDEERIAELAEEFDVSTAAMVVRLKDLRLWAA